MVPPALVNDSFCPAEQVWLAKATPSDPNAYSARMSAITSGGFGICTCIPGTDECNNPVCGWDTAEEGYQRHHYTEATATSCGAAEELANYTATTDRRCATPPPTPPPPPPADIGAGVIVAIAAAGLVIFGIVAWRLTRSRPGEGFGRM